MFAGTKVFYPQCLMYEKICYLTLKPGVGDSFYISKGKFHLF